MQLLPASARLIALVALSPTPSAQCPDLDLRFRAPRADGIPALAVFDGGSGPELVAASTDHGLTAWDGEHWRKLDAGLDGVVHTFLVHDFGSGPELVVGGNFLHAGGVAANRIARFDGAPTETLPLGIFPNLPQAWQEVPLQKLAEQVRAEAEEHRTTVLSELTERQAALEAEIARLERVGSDHRAAMRTYFTEQLEHLEPTPAG